MNQYNKARPNASQLSKLTLAIVIANSSLTQAAPTGGEVIGGSANINGSTITQTSDVVIIKWDDFNIDAGETVTFEQNTNHVAINNILDTDPSLILGNINADGTVFLSNPNGFIFGVNSKVNTGSFLATTLDINYSNNETLLTSNADTDTNEGIFINSGANITSNGQIEHGGYLAFISKKIQFDPGVSDTNSNSGLYSENSDILLSNDIESSIKLAGLNISFSSSNVNDALNNLDLSDSTLEAKTIFLNSSELSDLLSSVVAQPKSITADHLTLSSQTLKSNSNIGSDLLNAIDVNRTKNAALELGKLSLEDKSGLGVISSTGNIEIETGTDLELSTGEIEFINGNLFGSNSNVTLNANTIKIGSESIENFGGSSGLGSLTINGDTILNSHVRAINNIALNGNAVTTLDGTTKLWSEYGSLTLDGSLTGTGNGNLYIKTGTEGGVNLHQTTGFSDININTSKLTINGNIVANNAISINNIDDTKNTEIQIDSDVTLESKSTSIEDFFFNSGNLDSSVSFNLVGEDSSLTLSNASSNTNNARTTLNTININHINTLDNTAFDSDIIIGGSFDATQFFIGNNNSINNTYELSLSDNTNMHGIENLDLSKTDLVDSSGKYSFSATGQGTSTASFKAIDNLYGFSLNNFNEVIFTENISTRESGFLINTTDNNQIFDAGTIYFNASDTNNPISISNNSGGSIQINSPITSNNNSALAINSSNGTISVGSISNLNSLNIKKDVDEGTVTLKGDISVSDSIVFDNLGAITVNQDHAMITTSGSDQSKIELLGSDIIANLHAVTLTSNSLALGAVTGQNIDLNSLNITLSNDIQASGTLNLLSDVSTDIVNIKLANDLSLSGDMDFLSSQGSASNFIGDDINLDISASNSRIYMHTFDQNSKLNSLSITSTNNDEAVEIFFDTHADTNNLILPTLDSIYGLSLLGGMTLNVGANQVFDTSSYDGQLDFSELNIIGSGTLTFKTGTGELSLGNITSLSEEAFFSGLDIQSSDKLNLHGELDIQTPTLDFSRLNAIELHTDLTLGTTNPESPTKIDFGSATLNGTHDLTLYSNDLTLGTVGNNIALQDLTVIDTSANGLSLSNDISVVGTVDIQSTAITLDNTISSSGLNVNISTSGNLTMSKDATISADYGDITLNASIGNIGIGSLTAGKTITVSSESGYLFNSIGDYISNTSTSTNITSENQFLFGLTNIGESVSNPIVLNVLNGGTINAESSGTIYIANLANAKVNATGRVIDGATGGSTASIDALTQLKLDSLSNVNLPTVNSTLGLINNRTWQVDEDESIRKIKTPSSSPAIYHSRSGWRLGQK